MEHEEHKNTSTHTRTHTGTQTHTHEADPFSVHWPDQEILNPLFIIFGEFCHEFGSKMNDEDIVDVIFG